MSRASEPQIDDPLGDDDLEVPFKYAITAYGADFPVDALVKRLNEGGIEMPPFQRSYVWTPKRASRFVESLLLGLPVPGIFLAREAPSQSLLVIDGQQRLRSLQYFYTGTFPQTDTVFRLKGVQKRFEGLRYVDLPKQDRRHLDDSIIHATVVKQDEPSEDQSSIYHIFERINTGGIQLHPQEIRTSIYQGTMCAMLSELNTTDDWRDIYGPVSKTMRDQELILRFFAFLYHSDSYERPMKDFLNKAMGRWRKAADSTLRPMRQLFIDTMHNVRIAIGQKAFRPKRALNAAVFDSVSVAVADLLRTGNSSKRAGVQKHLAKQYDTLLNNLEFQVACNKSTADEEVVRSRFELARSIIK